MTSAIPVTSREHLDALHCQSPTCDHTHDHHELILLARCHPTLGLSARYEAGILTIRCAECEAFIVAIEVK